MSNETRERAIHDVNRTFESSGTHLLAHIDRKWDPFEGEIDPVTVTATDPETGEKIAHFHLDDFANGTNLMEASTETHIMSPAPQVDVPVGVTLDAALDSIEAWLESGKPINSRLIARTDERGLVLELGVIAP